MKDPDDSAPGDRDAPDPNERLVKILDTEQHAEAMVVKGLLESAGIDVDMTSIEAIQDAFPGVGGTVILVREEDAEEARRILETYLASPASEEDAGEP